MASPPSQPSAQPRDRCSTNSGHGDGGDDFRDCDDDAAVSDDDRHHHGHDHDHNDAYDGDGDDDDDDDDDGNRPDDDDDGELLQTSPARLFSKRWGASRCTLTADPHLTLQTR